MTGSSLELAQACAARMFALGDVTVSRFFGGAGLRLDGVQFAMVMSGTLYLRVDSESREALIAAGGRSFVYRGESRDVSVASYLSVPEDMLSDTAALVRLSIAAHRAVRNAPTRRRQRRPRPAATKY
jgi:DNA transformation protein